MKNLMLSLAASMDDVEMTALVGDLEQAAVLVQKYSEEDFDVLISRGGTTEILRKKSHLPVVDIELSIYDLLRAIQLAQNSQNRQSRYTIVGFPAIIKNAYFLRDVLRYQIDLFTIHNEEEARKVLQQLAQEKCQIILCDMITNSIAHEYGLATMLINSGSESVDAAIRNAVNISRLYQPLRDHSQLLSAYLQSQDDEVIILDLQGHSVFSTSQSPAMLALEKKVKAYIPELTVEKSRQLVVAVDGIQYDVKGSMLQANDQHYAAFHLHQHAARSSMEKYGIRSLNKEEVRDSFFHSFYGMTNPGAVQQYTRYFQCTQPLMIVGETGTGKTQMAHMIYSNGPYQNAPLFVVDCALLQQKGWNFLLNHRDSPLCEMGVTVHFQNMKDLSVQMFDQLFRLLEAIHYRRRNHLIFTANSSDGPDAVARIQKLMNWFGCAMIQLPVLREHQDSIPQLASLYINTLNVNNVCEVVGIEPEGMEQLQNYSWPDNYDQFKRVLRELVLSAHGPYITGEVVRTQLAKERLLYPPANIFTMTNIFEGKTLEEIDMIALQYVLAREKNNRSTTAAKLGISRSTLWRMMQKMGLSSEENNTEV
ncbi:MAG: PrpR N-terminal domain-containing protein [Candidatus Ventricola sp.]